MDSCFDFFDDRAAVLAAPSFLRSGSGTRAETASLASVSGEQSSLVETLGFADKLDNCLKQITLCDRTLQGLLLELIAELDDNKQST